MRTDSGPASRAASAKCESQPAKGFRKSGGLQEETKKEGETGRPRVRQTPESEKDRGEERTKGRTRPRSTPK